MKFCSCIDNKEKCDLIEFEMDTSFSQALAGKIKIGFPLVVCLPNCHRWSIPMKMANFKNFSAMNDNEDQSKPKASLV